MQQKKSQRTASLDKWRCKICQFDNLQFLTECQMCQSPNTNSISRQHKDQKEDLAIIICPQPSCKQPNPITSDTCKKCSKILFPEQDHQISSSIKESFVKCKYCDYQNSIDNSFCVNCQRKLRVARIRGKSGASKKAPRATKAARYMGSTAPCDKCGNVLRIIDYTTHQKDICMDCEGKHPIKNDKSICIFCDKKLTVDENAHHDETCVDRQKFFEKKDNKTFDRCTDLQYQTMVYMHNKCQKLHYRKEKQLIQRIKKLGFSQKDLENLHHYIIHYAPIIIHMHVNTHFHFFIKDTHYRNQFETSMSSGSLSHSARTGWEDRMFDSKHHHATGFQRVKYGTMNFTNDPSGVMACSSYGQSYFLLKSHVRDRCTITDMDSSSPSSTLGTFRFIFHLLMKLSDEELKSAFEGSKGKQMLSNVIGAYKQIQIHGPVQFAKDIQRVYVSKEQLKLGDPKALLQQVKSFCSKHNVQYQLFQAKQPVPMMFGASVVAGESAPERIVGDKKQLTEQDLKPKPPILPFAGFGAASTSLFGFGSMIPAGSIFSAMPSSFGVSYYIPPKFHVPQKKKQYGVDYI